MHFPNHLRLGGALSLFLFSAGVSCADAPLTTDSAIRRAWSHDPVVQVIQLTPDLAAARAVQAGIRPNPQFSVDTELPLTGDSDWALGVGYSQTLSRPQVLQLAEAVARLASDTAPLHLRERQRLLAGEVRHLVYALALAEARAATVALFYQRRQEALELLRARHRVGEVADTDLHLLELETDRAHLAAQRVAAEAKVARERLALWLRWTGDEPLSIALDWAQQSTTSPAAALDPTHRPELALAQWAVEHADAEIELARAQSIASWTVGAGLHFARRANDVTGRLENEPRLSFGASRPWQREVPNRGEILGKQAARAIAEAEADALRERIRIELAETAAEATHLAQQTAAAAALLDRARALPAAWDPAYQRGELSLLQRLQIDERLNAIELDYLDLAAASLTARARYETALGLVPSSQP